MTDFNPQETILGAPWLDANPQPPREVDDLVGMIPPPTSKPPKAKKVKEPKPKVEGWRGRLMKVQSEWKRYDGMQTLLGVIPSGSLSLDLATGVNGLPYTSIVRISGQSGTGKSALAMRCAAMHLESGRPVLVVDSEGGWIDKNARKNGLNLDDPLLTFMSSQEYDGVLSYEVVVQVIEDFCLACLPKSGEVGVEPLIIVDSLTNLPTEAHIDAKQGDAVMAATARANAQWLRKSWVLFKEARAVMIVVDELVANIGGMSFAPKTSVGGGFKLGYLSQMTIELARVKYINEPNPGSKETAVAGMIVAGKIVKNRWSIPQRRFSYSFRFDGTGIDEVGEILALGVAAGEIDKAKGGFYTVPFDGPDGAPVRLHGESSAREWLVAHPAETRSIRQSILDSFGSQGDLAADEDGEILDNGDEGFGE